MSDLNEMTLNEILARSEKLTYDEAKIALDKAKSTMLDLFNNFDTNIFQMISMNYTNNFSKFNIL